MCCSTADHTWSSKVLFCLFSKASPSMPPTSPPGPFFYQAPHVLVHVPPQPRRGLAQHTRTPTGLCLSPLLDCEVLEDKYSHALFHDTKGWATYTAVLHRIIMEPENSYCLGTWCSRNKAKVLVLSERSGTSHREPRVWQRP